MSLHLDNAENVPQGIIAKTYGHNIDGNKVHVGNMEIALDDFLQLTLYVLTNTPIILDDPRLIFVEAIENMTMEANPGNPMWLRLNPPS